MERASLLCHIVHPKKKDQKSRFFPCLLHQNMIPKIRQLARDRKVPTCHFHRDSERSKDEHVKVDEVSDSSTVNQDLPLKKEASASAEPNGTKRIHYIWSGQTRSGFKLFLLGVIDATRCWLKAVLRCTEVAAFKPT